MLLKTRLPEHIYPALSITKIIPAVEEVELEAGFNWFPEETYPVVTTPLDVPKRTKYALLPFVLTPCKTKVIRFTQLGILVKSMLVPEVDATAVPLIKGVKFPVTGTRVCVKLLFVAGGVIVTMPVPLWDSISMLLIAIVPLAIVTPLETEF